jgi:two-component system, OmpR family, sensor kinase
MRSLRARLLAGLLACAAVGLLLLAGVTYAEQRSFLYDRVDQQVSGAVPTVARALDRAGLVPAGSGAGGRDLFDRGGPPGGGGPPPSLPPNGTYGQRRTASGQVLGGGFFSYGSQTPPVPRLPKQVPLGKLFTVDSSGNGPQYRVYAARDPEDPGITVVAVPLSDVTQTLHRLLRVEALVIAGVLLVLALVALAVVRLGLRPLDRIAATAGEIATGRLSKRVEPATPETEVGRLGLALNEMLDRLEQAFAEREASEERLRRFLADASHELRTPLAAVRGYAELFRIGAARSPLQTESSMQRIEEEAKRMGILVEDLLALARLDEVREPVREEVDLTALARDAVADAHATAPDRAVALEANGPVFVPGDPHLLRQVLANLLRNALVHTPAGTPVEVTVRVEEPEAVLEVRDHGRGLPPGDPARLFERFWRAERGRARGKGGAGLGLAIVGGIVAAHGGHVEAADAAGGGARFTVRLPRLG